MGNSGYQPKGPDIDPAQVFRKGQQASAAEGYWNASYAGADTIATSSDGTFQAVAARDRLTLYRTYPDKSFGREEMHISLTAFQEVAAMLAEKPAEPELVPCDLCHGKGYFFGGMPFPQKCPKCKGTCLMKPLPVAATKAASAFLQSVQAELTRARKKHPPLHSHHEAWAVLKEEVEEAFEAYDAYKAEIEARFKAAWQEVKAQRADPEHLRAELTQVAAMCARWAEDVCRKAEG